MADKLKPIPDGQHSVTPYLTIKNAAEGIEFYKQAFGAVEIYRITGDDGRLGHAELKIGEAKIMLSDEYPEIHVLSPQTLGGSGVGLHLYVEDVDMLFNQALAAGARELSPVKDQFDGDRRGKLVDPFGHVWFLSSRVAEKSLEAAARI
jgi:PhnB protein